MEQIPTTSSGSQSSTSSTDAVTQSNALGIAPPPPKPKLRRNPGSRTIPTTYTVRTGDTYWDIAARYLGTGTRWPEIYELNRAMIEQEAARRGEFVFPVSWRLWPGITLLLPNGV